MNFPHHPRQALVTLGVALLAAGAAPSVRALAIPTTLAPASHESLRLHAGARGVQIYECRAAGKGHAWTFVAPEADLFDENGHRIGSHGAGPHWRFSDGNRISARVTARTDAPHQRDIPWLLLEARTRLTREQLHSGIGRVRSIQRINTAGGQAPADGCDATTAGNTVRVPYTADYLFYSSR